MSVEAENCHVHPHPPEIVECWLGWECEQLPAMQGHFATGSFFLNCKGKGGLQVGKAAGSCFCLCLTECLEGADEPTMMLQQPEEFCVLMVMILSLPRSAALAMA